MLEFNTKVKVNPIDLYNKYKALGSEAQLAPLNICKRTNWVMAYKQYPLGLWYTVNIELNTLRIELYGAYTYEYLAGNSRPAFNNN